MDWKDNVLFPLIGPLLKAGLWLVSRTRLPQTQGKITLAGLQKPVEVLHDRWGIPHIYAQNIPDAFYAQGFIHAQERLWQMDFTRRVVFGRLAEVLGEVALPVDKAMRTMSMYKTAEAEAEQVPGDFCALLNAYAAGANAWIERAVDRKKLPVEFLVLGYTPEPWRLADSLGWGKMMCWTLAANWQSELYRRLLMDQLGPEKVAELEIDLERDWPVVLDLGLALAGGNPLDGARPYAGSQVGEGVGSNNWVLHGSRTTTGKPLLANDMHLELTTPGIWFENHLIGGELDVTGVSLPGVPMVIAGHNRRVAWGYTDAMPDAQDLYEEHLRQSPAGGMEVEFKDEWLPVETRSEKIKIKGGKTVTHEVLTTGHGPIINPLFEETFPHLPPLALKWTALEPDKSFQAIYKMNTAGSCAEFKEALRDFDNPSQNVVYADVDGNIGYTMNGRVPMRAKGDGTVPAPGWTGEYEWLGYVPHDELPHLSNPPSGYVATANNQVQRPEFPHFIGRDYLVAERIQRITEMIDANEKIDIGYIQSMHFDQTSVSARKAARVLGALHTDDPALQEIIHMMREWDGLLNVDSTCASIFEAVIREAGSLLVEYHLGDLGKRARGDGPFAGSWPEHLWEFLIQLLDKPDSPWFDLGHGEKRDDVMLLALRQAVDFLQKELGPDKTNWKWGRLHQITFNHFIGMQKPMERVFSLGPFPIGGDGNTIWASFTSFCNLDHCPVVGPPYRFIADLGDIDHCWGVLAPGQSGHLASKHFADGIKPWFESRYHPVLFRRDEIEKELEARLNMLPLSGE